MQHSLKASPVLYGVMSPTSYWLRLQIYWLRLHVTIPAYTNSRAQDWAQAEVRAIGEHELNELNE